MFLMKYDEIDERSETFSLLPYIPLHFFMSLMGFEEVEVYKFREI